MTALLQVQRMPSCSAADVEHPSAGVADGPSLANGPISEWREVRGLTTAGGEVPIITLHKLVAGSPRVLRVDRPTERVFL